MFFFSNLCVFFCFFSFPRKSSSVIHSFDFFGEKKNKPEKKNSFFIHSFEIPKKCEKTNFSGEIKKYGTFVQVESEFESFIFVFRANLKFESYIRIIFTNLESRIRICKKFWAKPNWDSNLCKTRNAIFIKISSQMRANIYPSKENSYP